MRSQIIPIINGLYYSPKEIKGWIAERKKRILLLREKSREFWNRRSGDHKNKLFWECWDETFYTDEIQTLIKEIKKYEFALRPGTGQFSDDRKRSANATPIETLYDSTLRKIGKKLVGRCPFHEEDTGSFYIYTESNTFHCFGCGAGSDTIDYIMKRDSLSFNEAIGKILGK